VDTNPTKEDPMALPTRRRTSSRTLTSPGPSRRDPVNELENLTARMAELIDSAWAGTALTNGELWSPPVDIEEADDAWIVEADLPGAEHDDIEVDVRDNELIVTGDIKERERKGILRRRMRRTGQFEYRVTLPGEVDADNVEASLKGGVLTVRVPKSERGRPRRVEVTGS
jgi:HSP20 family protein